MTSKIVSIVIPAYNNAEYLGETICSVLRQTYPHFEIIVVDDASPDNIKNVIMQFDDPRIKYIAHSQNKGLSAARNTGMLASQGDYIALLDGDDLFHPDKLRCHVEFLNQNSDIGATYNPRFELDHSSKTIRDLWRPPLTVDLSDLIMGFPFSPSDMVIRREWAFRVNLFDIYYTYVGEDLDINCRLAMDGCQFASVDRALNYRRYHSGRKLKNLKTAVEDTLRPLQAIFADPRCPQEILSLKDRAIATHYLLWAPIAFNQDEIELGQAYCLEAVRRNPSFLNGNPSQLIDIFIYFSIADESVDHDKLLRRLFYQLPSEIVCPIELYDWAVARGYIIKGTRNIIWGRLDNGADHFEKALAYNGQLDDALMQKIAVDLISYEHEFGLKGSQAAINNLSPHIVKLGSQSSLRKIKGYYAINLAFQKYRAEKYAEVPQNVISAVANNPKYLANKGLLSILLRSILSTVSLSKLNL